MNAILTVNVPIANLRKEPSLHDGSYREDPLQESQLLLGEPLLASAEKVNGWFKVHAPQQPFFSKEGGWSGYPGWVQEEDVIEVTHSQADTVIVREHEATLELQEGRMFLSLGTCLEVTDECELFYSVVLPNGHNGRISKVSCQKCDDEVENPRETIIEFAKSFLDMPYLWGGLSSYMPDHDRATGVDCSGFIYLIHKMMGQVLPRNAHDQFLRALKLDSGDLQPGDLIFTAKKTNKDRMTHVMMLVDDERLIEADSKEGKVRIVDIKEKLGIGLRGLEHGAEGPKNFIFFGTFL